MLLVSHIFVNICRELCYTHLVRHYSFFVILSQTTNQFQQLFSLFLTGIGPTSLKAKCDMVECYIFVM